MVAGATTTVLLAIAASAALLLTMAGMMYDGGSGSRSVGSEPHFGGHNGISDQRRAAES